MSIKHLRWLPILLLLVLIPWLQAQDAESTPEATAESPAEIAVGAVTLQVPENWYLIEGQRGEPILSNVDLLASAPSASLPADAVLVQINILSKITLPPEFHSVKTEREFLEAIPVPEGEAAAAVVEIEANGVQFAKVDTSQPDADSTAYVRFLSDDTLIFALVAATQSGVIPLHETTILESLTTIQVDLSAPFADDLVGRYEDIPQSLSAEGFPQLGDPDAPVTIIEISSFDCPACKSFHDFAFPVILDRIKAGDVLFIYVPIYGTGSLPNGDFAARGALCAAEQEAFWAFHDGLFGWQEFRALAFMGERLSAGITTLELDSEAYIACLASAKPNVTLDAAFTYARAVPGFNGTPTVLLGNQIINWTPELLDTLIDDAIAAAEAATPEPEATVEVTAEATAEPTTIGEGF